MWSKADNVQCCAQDEHIHHVSFLVGGGTNPGVPIVPDETGHSFIFLTQQDSLNFHGIYEVSMEPCLIRWWCYATRLQPHWVPASSSAISSPFYPHTFYTCCAPCLKCSSLTPCWASFSFFSSQLKYCLPGTLPWPLLFSEGTLPYSVLTLHIVSTVVPPLSFFHGMYPDWGWAEIWRLVDLQ